MTVRAAAVALALLAVAGGAFAEDGRAYRLLYDAPRGCPDEAAFAAAVESRSPRLRRGAADAPAVDVDVRIAARDDGFLGTLRIHEPNGVETTRDVLVPTCDQATSAMSLMVTIWLDPDAKSVPSSADRERDTKPDTTKTPVEHRRRAWWLGANVSAGFTSAPAPVLVPDFGASVALGATSTGWFSPLLQLSALYAQSSDVATTGGEARFRRVGGRLTLCPVADALGPFRFRPCALLELGQLEVTGSKVPSLQTVDVFWSAFGVTTRGELKLGGPLFLGADLGFLFPFPSRSFYFEPSKTPVYQLPGVAVIGSIELGVRFL